MVHYEDWQMAQHTRAWLSNHRAHVAMLSERWSEARQDLEESDAIDLGADNTFHRLWMSFHNSHARCEIALSEGTRNVLFDTASKGIAQFEAIRDKTVLAWILATLAGAFALDEEPERGAVTWGAAEALRDRCGARIAPASRKNRERTVALLMEHLGQARFDELCAEGARMWVNQMLAYARAGLPDTAAEQSP